MLADVAALAAVACGAAASLLALKAAYPRAIPPVRTTTIFHVLIWSSSSKRLPRNVAGRPYVASGFRLR
jgi:hypothetical protein